MEAFAIDQGAQYYQGLIQNDERTILWTDGKTTKHSKMELKKPVIQPYRSSM